MDELEELKRATEESAKYIMSLRKENGNLKETVNKQKDEIKILLQRKDSEEDISSLKSAIKEKMNNLIEKLQNAGI